MTGLHLPPFPTKSDSIIIMTPIRSVSGQAFDGGQKLANVLTLICRCCLNYFTMNFPIKDSQINLTFIKSGIL